MAPARHRVDRDGKGRLLCAHMGGRCLVVAVLCIAFGFASRPNDAGAFKLQHFEVWRTGTLHYYIATHDHSWANAFRRAAGTWNRARIGIRLAESRRRRGSEILVVQAHGTCSDSVAGLVAILIGGRQPTGAIVNLVDACPRGIRPEVAAHEIGHVLGLGHEAHRCAVMQPLLGGGPRRCAARALRQLVLPDDIAGARRFYAAPPPLRKVRFKRKRQSYTTSAPYIGPQCLTVGAIGERAQQSRKVKRFRYKLLPKLALFVDEADGDTVHLADDAIFPVRFEADVLNYQAAQPDTRGSGFTFNWNFGDPASGEANTFDAKNCCSSSAQHRYAKSGTYVVKVTATDRHSGLSATFTKRLTVDIYHPEPVDR